MRNNLIAGIRIVLAEILTAKFTLYIFGAIIKIAFRGKINTVALFYPANRRYLESVTFPWYAAKVKWHPRFAGIFRHGDGGGLVFYMGACEDEMSHPSADNNLRQLYEEMQGIAAILGIDFVAYSGVLPSLMSKAGIQRAPIEVMRTVQWIVGAIELLRQRAALARKCNVVVLGAAGFVGKRVVSQLTQTTQFHVIEVDPEHEDAVCRGTLPVQQLHGSETILVNISRAGAIESYIDLFWPGLIVLNEVYPECSGFALQKMKLVGVRYFHLRGVEGWSFPQFPGAYAGAVPCCAASAVDPNSKKSELIANILISEV